MKLQLTELLQLELKKNKDTTDAEESEPKERSDSSESGSGGDSSDLWRVESGSGLGESTSDSSDYATEF